MSGDSLFVCMEAARADREHIGDITPLCGRNVFLDGRPKQWGYRQIPQLFPFKTVDKVHFAAPRLTTAFFLL